MADLRRVVEAGSKAQLSSPSASIRPSSSKKHKLGKPSLKNPQQLVTLFAGGSLKKYIVHKEFACHCSPVLKAAFGGSFIEGRTQEYTFQETSEEAIRLLIHWLYTGELDTLGLKELNTMKKQNEGELSSKTQHEQDQALVELWVLGGKLLIHRLQNAVADEIIRIGDHISLLTPYQIP